MVLQVGDCAGVPVRIDTESVAGIAICAVEGSLTMEDILSHAKRMLKAAREGQFQLVWDLREARFDLTSPEVEKLALFVKSLAGEGGPRSAFVLSRDREFGLARIFKAHRDPNDTQVNMFRDMSAAMAWITQEMN